MLSHRHPANWYQLDSQQRSAWEKAEREREDLEYDRDRAHRNAEDAQNDMQRRRREMGSMREDYESSMESLRNELDEAHACADELREALKAALTWLEHPAVHDAFRPDTELYARLSEYVALARKAFGS